MPEGDDIPGVEALDPSLAVQIAAQDDELVGYYNYRIHGAAFGLEDTAMADVIEAMSEEEVLSDVASMYNLSPRDVQRARILAIASITGHEVGFRDDREA